MSCRILFAVFHQTWVELEAHEPKRISSLYSASYLSLKTHVQRKVQRTLQSRYQDLMHCKSMKNAETSQIPSSEIWSIGYNHCNFALG